MSLKSRLEQAAANRDLRRLAALDTAFLRDRIDGIMLAENRARRTPPSASREKELARLNARFLRYAGEINRRDGWTPGPPPPGQKVVGSTAD